jgi:transcriptional regulator with GAF, ATPase, and Fis domain/tetratricopeptide (TPR) repeat protein
LAPATDLFGLGATLFKSWSGSAPYGEGVEAVASLLSTSSPAPLLSSVRSGLPVMWDRLLAALLERRPEHRWTSARSLLRELGPRPAMGTDAVAGEGTELLPPYPAGDPLAGILVGRAPERDLLTRELHRLAEGVSPYTTIALVGGVGSGRRTLIEWTLRDLAISQVSESQPDTPLTIFRGSLTSLTTWLRLEQPAELPDIDQDPLREQQRAFARLASGLELQARDRPAVVALDEGPEERAFACFVAGAPTSGRFLIVVAVTEPISRISCLDVPLPPFAADDVRELVRRGAEDDAREDDRPSLDEPLARVIGAAAGHPATVAVLARQLVEAIRRGEPDRFEPEHDAALDDLLARSLARLPAESRGFVAAVGLGLLPALGPAIQATGIGPLAHSAAGEPAARAAGWVVDHAGGVGLPSTAHELVLRRALGSLSDLREVARAALAMPELPGRALAVAGRAACLEAVGRRQEAAAEFRAAAHRARGGARPGGAAEAARWLEEAARLIPECLEVDERIFLVNRMTWQGRGRDALVLLDRALGPGGAGTDLGLDAGDRLKIAERKAWLLSRSGDLSGARQLLVETLDLAQLRPGAPSDLVDLARARLSRVLISMGLFDAAIDAAQPCLGWRSPSESPFHSPSGAATLAAESALLAHAYRGNLPASREILGTAVARALPASRLRYIAALLDQLEGDLGTALDGYRRALPEAESSGDIHTLAAIALNMGALAAEAGRYDEALVMQDRAIRELGRLGSPTELAVALFNAGMLLIELGDLAAVRRIVARLQRETAARPATSSASIAYLEAELALRDGDQILALELFTRASEAAGLDASMGLSARIARAELLGRGERPDEALCLLDEVDRFSPHPRVHADSRLTRARVLLAHPGPLPSLETALRLATDLEADAESAAREGRRPRAWRGRLTAARLFHRAGRTAEGISSVAAARKLFEEVRMSTPVDHQAGLENDPDGRFLVDLARLSGPPRETGLADQPGEATRREARGIRASRSEDRLRRLLRINKRLNSELRLPRLLELIMDTVIELTEAERGFILLEDDKGELSVKVARNIDQQTLQSDAFQLSGSIARKAAAGGTPIVTIDAAGDPRFRESLSVSDLHLRSVLAVPLQVKGRAVGTLYVDNRLRQGAFGEDDVQLVLDFAEQAGIAIENARLLGELRRRERQIEVLNRRLEGELAVRKEELSGMRQELRENRDALAIRYDYRNIIGRTPRMLDLFRLLDRLTDTALPVVIQGESGTGKELVARALHFNGPRRERAFVSENCAAIPETLLESTLFGAVRGAYTGADHDTRGLFEVADGGTLFLDEVGEMSAGMQGKLLRVLQAGELRRVGSDRTRKVDVRVIAATNRDLARLVEEGRFRQDLFFRLSVAPITLPPLRDRREDIPAIVEHVLAKISATNKDTLVPKRVEPQAMARLTAYRWPGNVRELENELMRAAAMSDTHIGVGDLSTRVVSDLETAPAALDNPDNLSLRPRVERLERALLREALSRSGGNQTRAAAALGLSRFGLQKKLIRYHMS